jgi:uncharacterized SAM-binding protein YcdF (DUF218 family)
MFVMRAFVKVLQPFPLLWLVMLLMIGWWLWRGERKAARVLGAMWAFLSIWSCTALPDRMVASVEAPWRAPATGLLTIPPADAIVCLGGGHSPSASELTGINLQENSDRIATAISLLRAGKAPMLYTSGGKADDTTFTEAEAAQHWAELWLPELKGKITPLSPSADTHDEAMKIADLAKQHGWKRVILVTSASHMTRSHAVFAKACGIDIAPAPCAFITKPTVSQWLVFPTETGFHLANVWWHEWLGWWGYKLRGWA